jgi:tripartite-type tricarboxylate transporter receptor subunit TctC
VQSYGDEETSFWRTPEPILTLTPFRVATIRIAMWAAAAFLTSVIASAADYPNKPIRLVVPAAPGGGTDIVARLLGLGLTDAWRVAIVIDNRGGAGGVPAIGLVAKQSAADGYTLLVGSNGHLTFGPALYKRLPYDPRTDFAPISLLADQPFVVVVHPSLPAKSIGDLIALAKKSPGKITYGSGGSGSAPHLGAALLQVAGGMSMLHVPYKGSGLAIGALMSGEIQVLVLGLATVLPLASSGKLRSLAVTTAKRSRAAPDIPTVAESGLPGFDFDVWYGVAAPAGTPREIIAKLNREIARLIKSPALSERYAAAGLEPISNTPEQFAAQIRREIAKWQKVVKDANIPVE